MNRKWDVMLGRMMEKSLRSSGMSPSGGPSAALSGQPLAAVPPPVESSLSPTRGGPDLSLTAAAEGTALAEELVPLDADVPLTALPVDEGGGGVGDP